jgi:hypothetical protein
MTAAPSWRARLACGHHVDTQGKPTAGRWLSCLTAGCWRQAEIVAVSPILAAAPVRVVPAGVQLELWEAKAA